MVFRSDTCEIPMTYSHDVSKKSSNRKTKLLKVRCGLVRSVRQKMRILNKEYANLKRPNATLLDAAIQMRIISLNARNMCRSELGPSKRISKSLESDCLLSMLDYFVCSMSAILPVLNKLPIFKQFHTKTPPLESDSLKEGLDDIAFILPDDRFEPES